MSTPLALNSSKLRNHRYEAWIGVPHPDRPDSWRQVDLGRFATVEAAKRWAEARVADYPSSIANLTYYSARDGWQVRHVGQYASGDWS